MVNGPGEQGFDYSFVAMRGIQAGPYAFFENDRLFGDPSALITWQAGNYGDTRILKDGIGLPSWNTRQVGPTLLSKALEFLEAHQSASTASPFFMYLNTQAVHDPRKPPATVGGRPVQGTTGLGARTDMLVEIDAIVDALLRKLEQQAILQDTLIIFTSDNGAIKSAAERTAGHLSSGGFREGKGSIYEGGHRVPLIMKWGPQAFGTSPLPQGTRIDALVGAQDIYATLAELTETSLPLDQARDSFSMLRALMGEATTIRDHMVHEAEIDASGGSDIGGKFAYRADAWKLIFNGDRVPSDLYDLANDPFETTNLVSRPEQSSRVATMWSAFENALTCTRTAPPTGCEAPEYSLSPTSVAFGSQPLKVDSAVQVVTLSSTGESQLTISSMTITGSNPGQFSQGNNCSATQPPGSTCTISVKFRPTSTGSKKAFVTVTTDGAGTQQVALTGTGVRSALSVSPASLAFGNQARGTVSAAQVVTITNTGTVFLPILSITIGGSNSGQFRQTNNCPAQVAVGESCAVSVTFNPRSTGNKFATLRIAPGGGASERSIALTGTGT